MPEITGYRDLTSTDVALVNRIKEAEIHLGQVWNEISQDGDVDGRWLAIAKTHFQQGFMAFVRSVTQPDDVFSG
jgi:hypothetical protein